MIFYTFGPQKNEWANAHLANPAHRGVGSNRNMGGQKVEWKSITDNYVIFYTYDGPKNVTPGHYVLFRVTILKKILFKVTYPLEANVCFDFKSRALKVPVDKINKSK